jgi:hypothetical protein
MKFIKLFIYLAIIDSLNETTRAFKWAGVKTMIG